MKKQTTTKKEKPKKEELYENQQVSDSYVKFFEEGEVNQQEMQEFLTTIEKNSKWIKVKLSKFLAKSITGGPFTLYDCKKRYRLTKYSDNAVLSTVETGEEEGTYTGTQLMATIVEEKEIEEQKVAQLTLGDKDPAQLVEEVIDDIPVEKTVAKRGRGRPKGTTKKRVKKEINRYLLANTGVKTLIYRLGVNCPASSKLAPKDLSTLLNLGTKVVDNKEALVLLRNEKIRAVNGGSTYKVLPQNMLFKNVTDILDRDFNGAQFVGGEFTYEQTKAIWICPDQAEDLMKTYRETLEANDIDLGEEYVPAVEFYTSDVGEKSATVNALLKMGYSEILIGSPIKVDHLVSNTKTFAEILDGLFAQFQNLIVQLENLISIDIKYPINTIIGCAKNIGLLKGFTLEEISKFEDLWSKGKKEEEIKITAHDIFYALQDILSSMKADEKVSKATCAKCAENLTRLLSPTYNWKDVDVSVRPDF